MRELLRIWPYSQARCGSMPIGAKHDDDEMLLTTAYDIKCTREALIGLDPNTEVVEAVFLPSGCQKPATVEIPLRQNGEPAVDCWMPFTRGFSAEIPAIDDDICSLSLDSIPGITGHELRFHYKFYFFNQSTLNLPPNICVASFSRSEPAGVVYGDIIVLKYNLQNELVDINREEKDLMAIIAHLAAQNSMFRA